MFALKNTWPFSKLGLLALIAIVSLVIFEPTQVAKAQSFDCSDPTSQVEMTHCAAEAHKAADEDLNLAYKLAVDQANSQDQYLQAGEIKSRTMLRDAQRAWITFRDRACETESTLARGGTLQNQIFFSCMERLTRQRTEDLRIFGEVN